MRLPIHSRNHKRALPKTNMMQVNSRRTLLAALLTTALAGAAQAGISVHSIERHISADTSAAQSATPTGAYNYSNMNSSAALGNFADSFTQGGTLALVSTNGTVSHNTTLTATAESLSFGGTLQLSLTQTNVDDLTGNAGSADLDFRSHFILDLEIDEDVHFSLVGTTSYGRQFAGYETTLTLSGSDIADISIGDAFGFPNGPASVNTSGTLHAGQTYRLAGYLRDVWDQHGDNITITDARSINFNFEVSPVPEPTTAVFGAVTGLAFFLRRRHAHSA